MLKNKKMFKNKGKVLLLSLLLALNLQLGAINNTKIHILRWNKGNPQKVIQIH